MEGIMLTSLGRAGWDPLAEMRRMQAEMNRLFAGLDENLDPRGIHAFGPAFGLAGSVWPPVTVWVGEDSAVVTAALPGLAESDIDLSIREDTLTIQGRHAPDPAAEKADWHRRERRQGSFSRVVELPFRIDPERVQARFAHGILEVELQRPEADRPRRIPIGGG